MNLFASIVLIAWIPIVVPLFTVMPTRRAVIVAYIGAWLFLPNGGFGLPGLPDFTKVTATSMGVLLGGLLFDPGPIFALRPRWFDLPMLILCICPFASSISNDLGAYDGTSALVSTVVTYGVPYLIGRAYIADFDGLRDLAVGIVVSGLVYTPFCLWEMRMSPQLQAILYGRGRFGNSIRYGGYRPLVFMNDGLEVGMWMASAAMLGYWLWAGGTIKKIANWPAGVLAAVLLVTAVLCKSTGAILQMLLGLVILWTSRRFQSVLPALVLASIAPLYCGMRTSGLWDGRVAVSTTASWFGEDRAGSLEFRLDNEDMLMAKALQRPIFGWGGWGRARVFNDDGKDLTVTDGLWIIALGNYGLVGLASHIAILILPLLILARSIPARRWSDPDVAAHASLAVMLALYMIDNISNAMFNPIYYLAAGALMGPSSLNIGVDCSHDPTEEIRESNAWEIEARQRAMSLEEAADQGRGGWAEAVDGWKTVIDLLRCLDDPSGLELVEAYGRRGFCLARLGRWREAVESRDHAMEILTVANTDEPGIARVLADARNDLAWLLVTAADSDVRNPSRAYELASSAVRTMPNRYAYHSTLGAALVRSGRHSEGIAAIARSMTISRKGGSAFDYLFLAIAHVGLGDEASARDAISEADAIYSVEECGHPDFEALRMESVAVFASRFAAPT